MDIRLNLDEYLKKYQIFNVADSFLEDYADINSNEVLETHLDPNSLEDYYRDLLETRYPTIAELRLYLNNLTVDIGGGIFRNLSEQDWYFVATNAYMLKGTKDSVIYISKYLGIDIVSFEYDSSNFKTKLVINLNTTNVTLSRLLITEKLLKDLLFLSDEENVTCNIEIVYLDYFVRGELKYKYSLISVNNCNIPDSYLTLPGANYDPSGLQPDFNIGSPVGNYLLNYSGSHVNEVPETIIGDVTLNIGPPVDIYISTASRTAHNETNATIIDDKLNKFDSGI